MAMGYRIETTPGRLQCLDVLRGMDMFLLTALGTTLRAFGRNFKLDGFQPVMEQLSHARWEGFTVEDIIMPLFMFCAGAAIPYSLSKVRSSQSGKKACYMRILRRVVLLWILGMVYQGNLLDFNLETLKLFSNTLQSIAVGYLFSSILYLHTSWKTQVLTGVGLLGAFWALMMFVSVGSWGGGSFLEDSNLCEYVDRVVLGSWRDGATVNAMGQVVFADGYTYTWILSSLNFIVTVLSGMLAGELMRSHLGKGGKFFLTLGIGLGLTALGLLWNYQMPIIKHIWTSSMVLFSSGICYLLLAFCFLVADWMGLRILNWLIPIGTNCLLAYLASRFVDFQPFFTGILYGTEQFIGSPVFNFIIVLLAQMTFMLCFDLLHRHKIFFRV